MQQNQPKGAGSREQDNPEQSQVIERNIRAISDLRTKPEAALVPTACNRSSTTQGKPYD